MAAGQALLQCCKELDTLEVESHVDQRFFIPFGRVRQLLTREKIQTLLEASNIKFYDRDNLIKAVLHRGRKVLATLVSIHEIDALTQFVETDHLGGSPLDARLPLDLAALEPIFPDQDSRLGFFRRQWRFLAPTFQVNQSYRVLREETILPFVHWERVITNAAYGEIYRVTIEASHQNIQPGRVPVSSLLFTSCLR